MSRREKILVSLTFAVTIGAGLFLLLDRLPDSGSSDREQSEQASPADETLDLLQKVDIQPLEANASAYGLQSYDMQIARAASNPWPKGIFRQDTRTVNRDTTKDTLHYSGYLETGSQYVAIINGLPFAEGDCLRGTMWDSYRVQSITPSSVTINTPRGKQIQVAIQSKVHQPTLLDEGPKPAYLPSP